MDFTGDNIADARRLVKRSEDAAAGDSNDAEIEALQEARDGLARLVDAAAVASETAGAITVGIWISDYDGVPVVQIDVPDTAGRFRINVNDAAIWDQDTRTPFAPPADA
ncbi:hypothetical protein [Microbacterium sp.]|uniref:hypothetical protein n=1 Tax=Microbacterium sp. TaxID=51671 RepID=UPI003F968B9E